MNPFEFMKDLPALKQKAAQMQESIKSLTATGEAGGGFVKVQVSGEMKVTSIKIDPALLKVEMQDTLEVLVASAFNTALEEIKSKTAQSMSGTFGGLGF